MGSLLSQMMGTPKLSEIDDKINTVIKSLTNNTIVDQEAKDLKSLEDATGNFLGFISKDLNENDELSQIDKLFQDTTVPTARLQRYNLYDELYKSVPIIKRILTVYISNIVPKNPVNDNSFILNEKNITQENKENINLPNLKKKLQLAIDKFKLINKYKKIVLPNRLKYGDYFVEIINMDKYLTLDDISKSISASSNSILSECKLIENSLSTQKNGIINDSTFNKTAKLFVEFVDTDEHLQNIKLMQEVVEAKEDEDTDDENSSNFVDNLNKIILRYHKPHNIIILETKYNTCLGYLEVTQPENSSVNSSISSLVQKVVQFNSSNQQQDLNINKLISYTLSHIIKSINKNGKQIDDNKIKSIISSLDPSVFNFIKRLIIEQDLHNSKTFNKLKVRFIPPKYMVHFNNPDASDYSPFASSVVDPLIMPGKLYMLTQMSNIITKLSRASIIRKWTIDTGPSRMTKQNINKLKREIYNTRVTLNDLGSFKSISKILSDFRDMFVISQNGRTPLDMSIETTGDPNVKTEDLRDLRNELVSLSGVPAPYLGMHDVIELREQLSNINQNFATEISNHQDNDIQSLNSLLTKIFKEVKTFDEKEDSEDKKNSKLPTDYIHVSLIPPITLLLQLIEGTLQSVGNISGVFNSLQIPVDPYHLLEQYVPHIDWAKFKEKAEEYKSKTNVKGKSEDGGSGKGW
jgi:hypothetical protein